AVSEHFRQANRRAHVAFSGSRFAGTAADPAGEPDRDPGARSARQQPGRSGPRGAGGDAPDELFPARDGPGDSRVLPGRAATVSTGEHSRRHYGLEWQLSVDQGHAPPHSFSLRAGVHRQTQRPRGRRSAARSAGRNLMSVEIEELLVQTTERVQSRFYGKYRG